MLLYLLRHAIAQGRAESDATRELTGEGIAQARAVSKKLRQRAPQMDRVLCSPYVRARQTASYIMPLFTALEPEIEEGLKPGADVYAALDIIEGQGVENLLLVGHNPFMSKLLSVLVDGTIDSKHYVDNANLYCISAELVAPACGELVYRLNP